MGVLPGRNADPAIFIVFPTLMVEIEITPDVTVAIKRWPQPFPRGNFREISCFDFIISRDIPSAEARHEVFDPLQTVESLQRLQQQIEVRFLFTSMLSGRA